MAKTQPRKAPKATSAKYRVRFVEDPDGAFEECNGESRPLTEEEYAENQYMGCPDHPHAGTTVITLGPPQVQGCAICGNTKYEPIDYAEYREYYGNPDRHVYLQADVQRQCPCCQVWTTVGGTGWNDMMDDSAELKEIGPWYDRRHAPWFLEEEIGTKLSGHLLEIAREDIDQAKHDAP